MRHPARAACGSPPGGSSGPAAAASTGVVYGCGRAHWNRTHVNRARGRSSSRPQILRPRRRLLVTGLIDRPAAASRAPCGCLAASRAPGLPCLGVPQQCNRCVSSVSSSQMQRCDSVQPVERQQCSNATSRSGRSKLWMSRFAGLGPAFRPTERVIYRARGVAVSRTASLRTLRLALVAYRPLDNNPVRLVALGARRSLETALGRRMLFIVSTDWYP